MTAPPKKPPSKGLMMIAAYRAERLARRSALQASEDHSHIAHPTTGGGEPVSNRPRDGAPIPVAPTAVADPEETAIEPAHVLVDRVSPEAAEQHTKLAASPDRHRPPPLAPDIPNTDPDCAASAYVEIETVEAQYGHRRDAAIAPIDAVPAPFPVDSQPEPASTAIPATRLLADAPVGSVYDPPLQQIGFGPGMVIRLGQIGLHTASDLARADANRIRSDLGEISRLVDVDAWIRRAQQINAAPLATPNTPGAFSDDPDR